MDFAEKLKTLMKITETSSKELAREIHVDPSRISQLRTGMRGMPKNTDIIYDIADYLTDKVIYDAQKLQLSELLEDPGVRGEQDRRKICDELFRWLCDRNRDYHKLMSSVQNVSYVDLMEQEQNAKSKWDNRLESVGVISGGENIRLTNEDKREAYRRIMQYLEENEEVGELLFCFEENSKWYLEDPKFLAEIISMRTYLVKKGYRCIQILSNLDDYGNSYEHIQSWVPLYANGGVKPYYCPRTRDGIFRYSFLILPGKVAFYSSSIGDEEVSSSIIYSENPTYASRLADYFKKYLKMCAPAFLISKDINAAKTMIHEFRMRHARTIRMGPSLSTDSMPIQEIRRHLDRGLLPGLKEMEQEFLDTIPVYASIWLRYGYLDIGQLASAEQVRKGMIPLMYPGTGGDKPMIYYTPTTYVLHLKSIIRLMDTYEGYFFVPLSANESVTETIFIKERVEALIYQGHANAIYESSQPRVVQMIQDYLINRIPSLTESYRAKVRLQLIHLIKELEN